MTSWREKMWWMAHLLATLLWRINIPGEIFWAGVKLFQRLDQTIMGQNPKRAQSGKEEEGERRKRKRERGRWSCQEKHIMRVSWERSGRIIFSTGEKYFKYSKDKNSKCFIPRWLVMVVLSGQNGREPATDRLRGGIWKSHSRLLLRWLRWWTREQLIKICDAEIFFGKDDKLYNLCLLPLNYFEPDWTPNVAFCQTVRVDPVEQLQLIAMEEFFGTGSGTWFVEAPLRWEAQIAEWKVERANKQSLQRSGTPIKL